MPFDAIWDAIEEMAVLAIDSARQAGNNRPFTCVWQDSMFVVQRAN